MDFWASRASRRAWPAQWVWLHWYNSSLLNNVVVVVVTVVAVVVEIKRS